MKYRLPIELFQSILDTISLSDKATISNLSLVSSELCAIAQPCLFRKCSFVLNKITPVVQTLHSNLPGHPTIVGLPISRASKFLEIARQSPHLFGYIRSIEMKAEERLHDEPDVEDIPTSHLDNSGIALTEILLKALNVQELLFPRDSAPFRWSTLPRGLSDAILSIGPRLVSLDLVAVENGSFPVELLLKFPKLKRLSVDSAVQRSRDVEGNPGLKRISLQYLEIGQAYVQDEQLKWLYEDLDITQLRELFVRGTLMDINPLLCSHHLTRLEWNQRYFGKCLATLFSRPTAQYVLGFEAVVLNDDNITPGSDIRNRIHANFQHLVSLQELVIHGRLTIAPAHIRSNFEYVAACLQTIPDDNQLSRVTLNYKVNRFMQGPLKNVDFDRILSVLLTPTFPKLETIELVLTRRLLHLSHSSNLAPVGAVIDDAIIDGILHLNPVLRRMRDNGRVKIVVPEE